MTVFHSCKDDVDDREAFLGSFSMLIECSDDTLSHDMIISILEDTEDEVKISNLFGLGFTTPGKVNGKMISIDHEILDDGYMFTAVGNGTLSEEVLDMDFIIDGDGYNESCTAVATKK